MFAFRNQMLPFEEGISEGEELLRSSKTGPEDLTFELIMIGSIAIVCVILFTIYIFLAKVEASPTHMTLFQDFSYRLQKAQTDPD